MLIGELCGAAEQGRRRRYDPAIARDPVDRFQQGIDASRLAPAANRYVRHLVTGKIERRERHLGVGEKRLRWSVQIIVRIERREDHAGVEQQRAHVMAVWLSLAPQPRRHAAQPA